MANTVATVAGPPGDLLERHAIADEGGDCRAGVLAPQIALILLLFRAGRQIRIDGRACLATVGNVEAFVAKVMVFDEKPVQ